MKTVKIKKKIIGVAGLLLIAGSAASTTAGVYAATPTIAEAAPATNFISYDRAKSIAVSHAKADAKQLRKFEIDLDKERYGTFYEIEFEYKGYDYDYKINASTGAIVKAQKELEDPAQARYTGVA